MSAQGWWRRATLLPLVVVGVPTVLLATATPALALTATIDAPTAGATYTEQATQVALQATIRRSYNDTGNVDMSVKFPDGTTHKVASSGNGSLSGGTTTLRATLDLACPAVPDLACDGHTAANGTYTVLLTGKASRTATFDVAAAPAAPVATARATAKNQITVTWAAAKEPDIVAYEVYDGAGQLLQDGIPADTNTYVADYGDSGYAGEHTFSVIAYRSTCPTCVDTIASENSAPTSATLTEPTPTPPPGGGGSTGGGSTGGGSTGGGSDDGGFGSGGSTDDGSTDGSTGGGSTGGGATHNPGDGFSSDGGAGSSGGGTTTGGGTTQAAGGGVGQVDPALTQRRSFALKFKSFTTTVEEPKLPPLPSLAGADTKYHEPDGTYGRTLGYQDKSYYERVKAASGGGATSFFQDAYNVVFQGKRIWQSMAWALILLLLSTHLWRWLRSSPTD